MNSSLLIASSASLLLVAAVVLVRTSLQHGQGPTEDRPAVASQPAGPKPRCDEGGTNQGAPDWTENGHVIGIQLRLAIKGQSLSETEAVQLLEDKLKEGLISDEQFRWAAFRLSASMKEMDALLRLLTHFESGQVYEQIAKRAFNAEVLRDKSQIEKLSRALEGNTNDNLRLLLLSKAATRIEIGPDTKELLATLLEVSYSAEEESAILSSLTSAFAHQCEKPAGSEEHLSIQDVYSFGRFFLDMSDERSENSLPKWIASRAFAEGGVTELENAAAQIEIPLGAMVSDLLGYDMRQLEPAQIVELVEALDPTDPHRSRSVEIAVSRLIQSRERAEIERALAMLPLLPEERARLTARYNDILEGR